MKTSIISFLLFGSLAAFGQGDSSHATFLINAKRSIDLDNKTFHINLTQTKGKTGKRLWKWDVDEITFKGGRLTCKVMRENENYPSAVYYTNAGTSSTSDAIQFKVFSQSHHDGNGTISLVGTVTGDYVEGNATWISRVGTSYYSFYGTLDTNKRGQKDK